ncbi:hypothetical protein ACOJTA_00155 [Malaciobacter sp. WC5094]
MKIKSIANELNKTASDYEISNLQDIRKSIKALKRKPSNLIFNDSTISENWAFHLGGRSELQFNIGLENIEGIECLRFGVAFSLEPSQSLPDISILFPKIKKFNEFIKINSESFFEFKYWFWKNAKRSNITEHLLISSNNVTVNTFHFLGKYLPLDKYNIHFILETLDELLPLYKYVESVNAEPIQSTSYNNFTFKPNTFNRITSTDFNQAEKTINVNLRHNEIQKALYERLVNDYGEENVASEITTGIGNKVDMIVKKNNEYWYYEIKTDSTARSCIRQAFGQLMEYSFWPGTQTATRLIIVGEATLDEEADIYINLLRNKFSIPVYYMQQTS